MEANRRRRFKRLTFRQKLLIYSLFLSITPVLTVGLLSSYFVYHNVKSDIEAQQLLMLWH